MSKWFFFLILFIFMNAGLAADKKIEKLPIYLFELKPLVYQEDNVIKGAWYESFERLKKEAHLDFDYQFVSISRLELLLNSDKPGCNLTLLKTPERVDKMHINFIFYHPEKSKLQIYQRANDKRQLSLAYIKNNKGVKVVTNTSAGIDGLKDLGINSELLFNMNSIIRMLLMKRVDAIAASNLAIEKMDEYKTGQLLRGPLVKTFVHGIGCSRGTSPQLISRLQRAAANWRLE